jgi:hypothetical protein
MLKLLGAHLPILSFTSLLVLQEAEQWFPLREDRPIFWCPFAESVARVRLMTIGRYLSLKAQHRTVLELKIWWSEITGLVNEVSQALKWSFSLILFVCIWVISGFECVIRVHLRPKCPCKSQVRCVWIKSERLLHVLNVNLTDFVDLDAGNSVTSRYLCSLLC